MRSIEAEQPDSTEEEPRSGDLKFLFDSESGDTAEEAVVPSKKVAELLLKNPAFKSEQAERILSKIEDAEQTAQDIPIELIHELRHEHKDQSINNPVHIGEVVADTPSRQPGLPSFVTQVHEDRQGERTEEARPIEEDYTGSVSLTPTTSIYRQAVIYGFALAVVLLIIIVLFLILI